MADRRRYTKREKLATVIAAEMTSLTEASETTGIPLTTIDYWMDQPEFVAIRSKTREDLADEIKAVAHLAWKHVAQALRTGEMEPRDAIFAAEKATSLQILLTGGATARTETRDITGSITDADLISAIREAEHLTTASAGGTTEATEGTPEG